MTINKSASAPASGSNRLLVELLAAQYADLVDAIEVSESAVRHDEAPSSSRYAVARRLDISLSDGRRLTVQILGLKPAYAFRWFLWSSDEWDAPARHASPPRRARARFPLEADMEGVVASLNDLLGPRRDPPTSRADRLCEFLAGEYVHLVSRIEGWEGLAQPNPPTSGLPTVRRLSVHLHGGDVVEVELRARGFAYVGRSRGQGYGSRSLRLSVLETKRGIPFVADAEAVRQAIEKHRRLRDGSR